MKIIYSIPKHDMDSHSEGKSKKTNLSIVAFAARVRNFPHAVLDSHLFAAFRENANPTKYIPVPTFLRACVHKGDREESGNKQKPAAALGFLERRRQLEDQSPVFLRYFRIARFINSTSKHRNNDTPIVCAKKFAYFQRRNCSTYREKNGPA